MRKAFQKKLLILGGTDHMIDVVKTAKKMGYFTLVADNNPEAPAKQHAHQAYDISTADIEGMVALAKTQQVDGVFTAFEDINTWNAEAIAGQLGLPFYATKDQLEISSNKNKFKEYCRRFGVPVIQEYAANGKLEEEELRQMKFPVIIKPVDSYASKGITVCYTEAEAQKGFQKALEFSKSKKAIIEPFIDNSYGVQMFYTICNKEIVLSGVTDRYVHKQEKEHPPLPIAMTFPSKHQDEYLENVDASVREMLRGMGIENGLVFIQSLFENGSFYIYEMGFRFSGEQHYKIIEKQTGINLLEMMLEFAVGEDISKYPINQFDHGYMPYPSCNLPILLGNGTISQINGLDKLGAMPEVVSHVLNHRAGDTIQANGSYAQMFGRFNLVASSQEALLQAIDDIYSHLEILSTEGKEMIIAKNSLLEAGVKMKNA